MLRPPARLAVYSGANGGARCRMGVTILADILGRHIELTDAERSGLAGLIVGERRFKRGTVIRAERGNPGEITVVASGWLFCWALLEDGRRQIVRLHFRGDLLGLDGLAFGEAPDSVSALTDAHLWVIDRLKLGQLIAAHPRLGALLLAVQQIDRVTLTDRLISLGRASARGRVAALLVWLAFRLRAAGETIDAGFALPMTQEEIGDTTGLTAVHVNRTMRVLAEQGLIARTGTTLRVLDWEQLTRLANHVPRLERIDPSWLTPR